MFIFSIYGWQICFFYVYIFTAGVCVCGRESHFCGSAFTITHSAGRKFTRHTHTQSHTHTFSLSLCVCLALSHIHTEALSCCWLCVSHLESQNKEGSDTHTHAHTHINRAREREEEKEKSKNLTTRLCALWDISKAYKLCSLLVFLCVSICHEAKCESQHSYHTIFSGFQLPWSFFGGFTFLFLGMCV